MSERASRPLNSAAVQAADDELYANHAADPRPNALYDENGNRKPLDASDPAQADLRSEWMNAYKANGGGTEPADTAASDTTTPVTSCDRRQQVDPVIVGDLTEVDEADVDLPEEASEEGAEEEDAPAEQVVE